MDEGGTVTYTVTPNNDLAEGQTVDLSIVVQGNNLNGNANEADPNTDLDLSQQSVGFTGSSADDTGTQAQFTVTALEDNLEEGLEGFEVRLVDDNFEAVATETTAINDTTEPSAEVDLTDDADTVGPNVSDAGLRTTSGDDTINGSVDQAGNNTTLSSADEIDGGGGTDRLSVAVQDVSNSSVTSAPQMSGVENLFVRNTDGGGNSFTLDVGSADGVEAVWSRAATGGSQTVVQALDSTDVTVGLRSTNENFVAEFTDSAVNASDDSVDVLVENGTNANFAIGGGGSQAVESLEVSSTGGSPNTIDLDDASTNLGSTLGVNAVNVTGNADLTVNNNGNASLRVVDASGEAGTDRVTESTIDLSNKTGTIENGDEVSVDVGGTTVTATFSGDQDASGVASALASNLSNLSAVESASADSSTVTVTAATDEDVALSNFAETDSNDSFSIDANLSDTNTVTEGGVDPLDGSLAVTLGTANADAGDGISLTGAAASDSLNVSNISQANLNDSGGNLTIDGGDGGDTITVGSVLRDLSNAPSIDINGGNGTDTLKVDDSSVGTGNPIIDASNLAGDAIQNIEQVDADLSKTTNNVNLDLANSVGAVESLTITNQDNGDDHTLTLAEGTSLVFANNADNAANYTIEIANADSSNTANFDVTLGDSDGGVGDGGISNLNVDFVDTLTIDSTGGTNGIDNISNSTSGSGELALETLNVNAANDVNLDTVDTIFDGTGVSTFTANLSGEGDIDLSGGNGLDFANSGSNIEELQVTANGSGARTVSVNGDTPGNLSSEGVTVDGDSDITVAMNSAAIGNVNDVSAGNATGSVTLQVQDSAGTIDAANVSGIDVFDYNADTGGGINLDNLADGIGLQFSNDFTGGSFTFNNANVSELDVTIDTSNAATTNVVNGSTMNFDDQTTLNLTATGANAANFANVLSANSLETLNITSDAGGALDIGNLQARSGEDPVNVNETAINVDGSSATTINQLNHNDNLEQISLRNDGSGLLTVTTYQTGDNETERLDVGGSGDTNIDNLNVNAGSGDNATNNVLLNADGTGTVDIANFQIADGNDAAALFRTTGSNDISIAENTASESFDIGDGSDNLAANTDLQFRGDGDVTIGQIEGANANLSVGANNLTIESSSSDGSGLNTITDASNLVMENSGSTLILEGNQDLDIGDDGALPVSVGDGVNSNIDASNFSGDLKIDVDRQNDGSGSSDTVTVDVGTGGGTFSIDEVADTDGNDDSFTFNFAENTVGDFVIENFASNADGGNVDDKLDIDGFVSGSFTSYDNATGEATDGSGNVIVDFDVADFDGDGNDDLVGSSAEFDGNIVLAGVSDLGNIDTDNFV